jgi:membrane protein required for colicin V production
MINWADLSIVSLILLLGYFSYFQSFFKGLLSLISWSLSFIIAIFFLNDLTTILTPVIPFQDLRIGVAIMILFFSSFILIEALSYLLMNTFIQTEASTSERILSVFLGFIRGMVIVIFLIMLTGLTQLPTKPWWQQSILISSLKPLVIQLRSYLPIEVATQFNFDLPPEFQKPLD